VPGETNTDDLSPAPDAWSRPDIPLHYLAMLKNTRPDAAFKPEEDGKRGPIAVHRRRSRARATWWPTSATWSAPAPAARAPPTRVIWATGEDIPFVPNKRFGGVTLGGKIAPIFFNTQEDSGALPIEVDVSALEMGDVIEVHPYDGKITKAGATVAEFALKSEVLLDEVRAGGRINLIIGRAPHRQGARVPRPARLAPPSACPSRRSTAARASPWRRRWSAAPAVCPRARASAPAPTASRSMTTVGSPGHHRPDDARRAQGPGLPGLLVRPGDAVASATPPPTPSRWT
jgi:aconitate hydratase 2/2-methylisocitrate dehydratase